MELQPRAACVLSLFQGEGQQDHLWGSETAL